MYPALSLYLSQPSSAPVLTPVNVLIVIGDSQSDGLNNSIADLATTPVDYTVTDANVKTWDVTTQTIITRPAAGCEPAVMNGGSFPTPVGWVREYTRRWRLANPASALYVFQYSVSGSGFDAANPAGLDWSIGRSGGLYSTLTTQWAAFVAKLATLGLQPGTKTFATSVGWNSTQTGTLSAAYGGKLTALMAQLRTDILGATGIALIQRLQLDRVGIYTDAAIVRAAQATYVAGDAYARLVNCDGAKYVSSSDQHYTAAGHIMIGRHSYWSGAGLWYPQSDFANLVTGAWMPSDLQNTLVSSKYSVMYDQTGNLRSPVQATAGMRPAQITINSQICADFDGVDDWMGGIAPYFYAQGSGAIFAAVKSAAVNFGFAFSEAHTADFQPTYIPLGMGAATDGSLNGLIRKDGGVFPINTTIGPIGFNGTMNALAVTDSGSSMVGYVNGTAGTPVAYTRGPTTLNILSIGTQDSAGSRGGFIAMKFGEMWTTAAVPDATYRANALAYMQREYGTP